MKTKLFKTSSILLAGMIVFSACDKDEDPPIFGDVVGTWTLSGLKGTYSRTVVTKDGVANSADAYTLVASWNDAAGFAAATGADAAMVAGATSQDLASWKAGDNSPGFPRTNDLNTAALAAYGISMKGVFDDAPSKDKPGTYKITGTYPSIRLNTETCAPYLTVPQINDQGDYTVTFDYYSTGKHQVALAPAVDIEQVLPPFSDGTLTVDGDAGTMTIDFLDLDAHSSRYTEVMDSWSEADDRVISGIDALPRNTVVDAFTIAEDPHADKDATGALVTTKEAYIYDPSGKLASWGNFLTWYAFNIVAETSLKVTDVKNPLTDLDGDGNITPADMVAYMHYDNLASGGTVSAFGIPYAMLVNSSNPAQPVPTDDSAGDFALAGLATASGGKMRFTLKSGVCIPVDETISFESQWTAAE